MTQHIHIKINAETFNHTNAEVNEQHQFWNESCRVHINEFFKLKIRYEVQFLAFYKRGMHMYIKIVSVH